MSKTNIITDSDISLVRKNITDSWGSSFPSFSNAELSVMLENGLTPTQIRECRRTSWAGKLPRRIAVNAIVNGFVFTAVDGKPGYTLAA